MSKRPFEGDKMSCTVMYQPYAISSSYNCDRPPAEKKPFRFPYVPSPPDSLHSDASSYSHSSPGPAPSNNAVNNTPLTLSLNTTSNNRRPLTPTLGLPFSSSSSSAPATITSASQLLQIQQHSLRSPQRHHGHSHSHSSSSSSSASATITSQSQAHLEGEEQGNENDGGGGGGGSTGPTTRDRVQYLSANCVVYENYREETARVVEDHFNRALSAASSTKCSPMSTRNFPPSFWNSNYQPQLSSASKPFVNMGYGSDFYGAAVGVGVDYGLAHHHQTDPWHYPLTSHHQGYHHRPTDLSYSAMPSTSRFNAAQYGSFFLANAAASSSAAAASRFAAAGGGCSTSANLKGDTTGSGWPSGLYHHPHESLSELNLADYAAAAHYTNRTAGLETSVGVVGVGVGQESSASKDPYWF